MLLLIFIKYIKKGEDMIKNKIKKEKKKLIGKVPQSEKTKVFEIVYYDF